MRCMYQTGNAGKAGILPEMEERKKGSILGAFSVTPKPGPLRRTPPANSAGQMAFTAEKRALLEINKSYGRLLNALSINKSQE